MLGNTFYHETIRKCVIGFGTLFNDIHITRTDSSGNVVQSMKVPLAFGPKQKFLVRLREDPSISKTVAITLPRIGFQIGFFRTKFGRPSNLCNQPVQRLVRARFLQFLLKTRLRRLLAPAAQVTRPGCTG